MFNEKYKVRSYQPSFLFFQVKHILNKKVYLINEIKYGPQETTYILLDPFSGSKQCIFDLKKTGRFTAVKWPLRKSKQH